MSKKYYEKVLAGSGTSTVKVKSAFGSKILAKYGWSEGQGLGASMSGVKECVQIEKREERVGIGAERKPGDSEWDNWWSGAYDSVAAKINIKIKESSKQLEGEKKEKKEKRKNEDEVGQVKLRRVKRHVRDE